MNLIQKYARKNPYKIPATEERINIALDCGAILEMRVLFYFKILINTMYYTTILKGGNHLIVKTGGVKLLHKINHIFTIKRLS